MAEQDSIETETEQTAPAVGALITSRDTVSPDTPVSSIADLFFSRPQMEAVALVSQGRPVALANRNKILSFLFRRFGFELFGRDPIVAISDRTPLVVSALDPLDRVLDRAMARPFQDIYDEIIVTTADGAFHGLLSVKRMVVEQGRVLSRSLAQRQAALAREKEMKKVSALKSRFLAHVTHELRSPVNAIVGLAEVTRTGARERCPDALGESFDLLASTALGLRALITNILDLSKMEAGRMEIHVEEFDLSSLLRGVAETTGILVRGKDVRIVTDELPPSLPLRSDPLRVRQIVTNLADNAAKFTEGGSIAFALRPSEDQVHIAVADTGPGIREKDLEHLFSPFTQLEDAKTRRHEGSGLGLAITRELVHLLGGKIDVASVFGQGSTFTVTLPLSYGVLHGSD